MSLKTTPRGLLAALAALCIVLMQLPALMGGTASAAGVGAPRAATTTHRAATATHQGVRPHSIVPGSTESAVFAGTFISASLTPITGPVGTPITVTGTISPSTPVSVTVTDSSGASAFLGTTTSNATTGAFAVATTLPLTLAVGAATVSASIILTTTAPPTETASLPFTVNAPALTFSSGITTTSTTATRCQTLTITGTNYAPGVVITPTLVFSSSSGVTSTGVLSTVTPFSNGTAMEGDFTATAPITTAVAYSTTAAISVTSATYPTYPITPTGGYPAVTIATTPTITVTSGTVLTTGVPLLVVGMTNTLSITSSPSFQPNSPITFTLGLTGTAASPVTATAPVTSDLTGAFSATVPFSVGVAGTYVLTATDLGTCNAATATLTVLPAVPLGPPVSTTYFAEGYTGAGTVNGKASYTTTLDLLNPNVSTVLVTNTYLLETSSEDVTYTTSAPDVVVVTHTLAPLADMSVNVASDIAAQAVISGPDAGKFVSGTNQKVATIVQTAGFLGTSVRGVAAERLIERTANSGARDDGDISLGTTSANTSYYFAEGYTGLGFQEYLILLNPSPTLPATVTVTRAPEGAATTLPPLTLSLAPFQRLTVNVNRLNVGATESKVGLIVNSTTPIVAERVLYFGPGNGSAKSGETIADGLTTAAKQLNFAYGSLTGGFDVANPATGTVPAVSDVAQTIDDRPFIEVMNPNIAGQIVAGTVAGSATAPGPSAHVTISLRGEDGRLLGFFITDVDAGARFTLTYSDLTSSSAGFGFPGVPPSAPTRAGVFSVVVSSSERVVAELAQYFGQGSVTPSGDANSGAPGLDLVGAPSGETDVLFPALGATDPASSLPLSNTVFLYNPGVNPVQVNGTFYGASGVVAHQLYTIGPDAIQVIGTITATMAGAAAGAPIPAGTMGAEFSTIQQRGSFALSGEPGQAPETFVAAAVTHSADGTNWWGTQGLYPLPVAPSCAITDTTTGLPLQPLPGGCP